jgi:hypothetical protein
MLRAALGTIIDLRSLIRLFVTFIIERHCREK